ncbi:cytochrome c oxidase subunit 3 [Candidatus Magnetominusculus xianensis]|uniref:Cytochrome oxidase subunit III n=1 Tax=Candidatus Magnetominusculus xianensis TaxID=1748249 RepID=A0ABR5SGD1_9BACT|nr:heme-copper oxidase subunit III [Candidatus Magnetominusculus xianensis]KWT88358.1 cytochrome oxidase subunit III [Candidatus Magnetominusculus xianensis]MBF0405437.1 heme-copper oxidase subunit III [Nitrospirota bacterium]
MENVMHGGKNEVHHHEVELSVWPLIAAGGSFLIPIAFMTAFSWGLSSVGLVLAGVAVVVLIVGLFGWLNEVHAKKEDAGLSKLAIIVFIISEVALFGGLFGGYLYAMLFADIWPPANTPEGVPPIGLAVIMTVFLLSSSVTIHNAEAKIEHGDMGGFKSWLMFTTLLGALFIAFMAYEWHHMISNGFSVSTNEYGTFFYTITGFHGSHVIVGLVMQLFCLILAAGAKIGKSKQTMVKVTGLYWHFVDIIWLLVVSLIYVVPYLKAGQ